MIQGEIKANAAKSSLRWGVIRPTPEAGRITDELVAIVMNYQLWPKPRREQPVLRSVLA